MNCNRQLREVILDVLTKLLVENEFELVLFHYNMPPEYLSKNVAQTKLAIELVRYAENQPNHIKHLLNSIFRVKNEALERSAILNKQTTVLLSYTCDSDEHLACVLSLLEALWKDGINCRTYIYAENNSEAWLQQQIECTDFVLTFFSEGYSNYFYQENHELEAGLPINQALYKKYFKNSDFIPLALNKNALPPAMQESNYFLIPSKYKQLLAKLKRQSNSNLSKPTKEVTTQQANNPFIVGQPIKLNKHFFGREVIIDNLFRLWLDFPEIPIQNAAIWGEKRIGKTSLLLQLKALAQTERKIVSKTYLQPEKISKIKDYNWIYVDFQDARFNSPYKFLQYVLDSLHFRKTAKNKGMLQLNSENPLGQFIEVLATYLKKPTIILLDEVSAVLERRSNEFPCEFWEGLRALSTTALDPSCLGFVITSPEHPKKLNELLALKDGSASPFFNIFGYKVELQPFSLEEAISLINSSHIPFSEADKKFIMKQSQCKPHELQVLCRHRLDMLLNGSDKNDLSWQQDLLHNPR